MVIYLVQLKDLFTLIKQVVISTSVMEVELGHSLVTLLKVLLDLLVPLVSRDLLDPLVLLEIKDQQVQLA